MSRTRDHSGVYVPPPLFYAIPFAAGIALHHAVGHDRFPAGALGWTRPLGIVIGVSGLLLALVAEIHFARAGTSPIPIRPSTAFVTGGPYRFTRNPMYVALGLLYLGLPLILGYAWPYLFFPLAILGMNAFVIRKEERYLGEKFGEPYRRYREAVRRWL